MSHLNVLKLRSDAAHHSAATLAEYWDEALYPVDPFAIAKAIGITVFLGDLPEDVSGMLRSDSGQVSMYIDTDDHPRRQRFTAAHELGHYVRRQKTGKLSEDAIFVDRRGTLASAGVSPDEIYANEFAACLLMPRPIVRQLQRRGLASWEMAQFFDVSPASMEFRLSNMKAPSAVRDREFA